MIRRMRRVFLWTLLLFLSTGARAARSQGVTLLSFNSEPGDYVGQGRRFTLTPSDGTITVNRSGGGAQVTFSGASSWWYLFFVPRAGETLTPGVYEGVTRWPFQSPTTGGLSVYGNGAGCNTLTGRFTVLEAEYGSSGEVLRLAVDYEQHCEGGSAALFGSVRYASGVSTVPRLCVGSSVLYEGDEGSANMLFAVSLSAPAETVVTVDFQTVDGTALAGGDFLGVSGTATFPVGETVVTVPVPVLGDLVPEPDEAFALSLSNGAGASIAFGQGQGTILDDDPFKTFVSFNSEPGDWIGQGRQFTLTPIDGSFTFARPAAGFSAHFDGSTWWDVVLVPPAGATLTPGAYEGATRYPFQSPTRPGLDVSGDGRGCNTLTGRFLVHEAEYGTSGDVLRFAADYEQHCEGGAPALWGAVRYNSSVAAGPRLFVGPSTIYEGDEGVSNMGFVISLSYPAKVPVSVDYATEDGTATAGSDYTAVSGTATFPVGQTSVAVAVPVRADSVEEPNETFTLSLSNAVGAPIAFGQGQGTIVNDDPYKTLIRFDSEAGDWVGAGRRFTVTQADGAIAANPSSGGVRVSFQGSTWWYLTFVPPSGEVLTPGVYEGATRWPFQSPTAPGLDVTGDGRGCNTLAGRFTVFEIEYDASGNVVRFAVDYEQHCEGVAAALFGSVRYNSSMPLGGRLGVGGVSRYEGDDGPSTLGIVISLSAPAQTVVTVDYQTADGTATAGSDYTAVSGTATFPVGETAVVVPVAVRGDFVEETDETFTLSLTNAVGAPVAFGVGQGTILNDDPYKTQLYFNSEPGDWIGGGARHTWTLADGSFSAAAYATGVQVGFDGASWWDVTMAPPSVGPLMPGVYLGASRWGFQPAGTPGLNVSGSGRGCNTLTGRFEVLEAEYGSSGDLLRFAADFEQHCEGGDPALFGSVRYRSAVPRVLRLWVAGASVLEGNSGTTNLDFPVWLSEPAGASVTASFATKDGTALQGVDYAGYSGSATVPAGQTDGAIQVPVFGDTLAEANETFSVALLGVAGAAAGIPSEVVGTILTDDALPQVSVSDASVVEGNPGSPSAASFVVSLDVPSGQTVSVAYVTQQASATLGEDFAYTSGTLEVAPGATSGTIHVPIVPDSVTEPDETFSLHLVSPLNATISDGLATGTILNDDRDGPMSYYALQPCRVLDTRQSGPALEADVERVVPVAGICGIPTDAMSVVLNVTTIDPTGAGYLQMYAAGTATPGTSVVSFSAGRLRSGLAMVRLGADGALAMKCRMPGSPGGAAHAAVDVSGYFR
jgi:large repetitive protein